MESEAQVRMKAAKAELAVNFMAIDIDLLRKSTKDIPVEVYLKISDDNFAHVFSRKTGLDYDRLASYINKGVQHLYIRRSDEAVWKEFTSRTPEKLLLDPGVSPERKLATLINMTEQNMSEIFSRFNIDSETAEGTRKVVHSYVNIMSDSPQTLTLLLKLAAHGDYLYYHAVSSAIISMFIAKATGKFDRKMLELTGFGAFLHDIGMTQISTAITSSEEELSPDEWKEMKEHPRLGLSMLQKAGNVPDEVKYIIYQHHEQPDGGGYPNGLKGDGIFFPAKIVAVGDAFSAMLNQAPWREAFAASRALELIQKEKGKYDPEIVSILISIFSRDSASKGAA